MANLILNPSAETNLTGIAIPVSGTTLTRETGILGVTDGSWAVQAVNSGSTNGQGVVYSTQTGLATMGGNYTGEIDVTATLGAALLIRFRYFYTDASNAFGGNNLVTADGTTQHIAIIDTASPVKTLDYISFSVTAFGAQAVTIVTDLAVVEAYAGVPVTPDGPLDPARVAAWIERETVNLLTNPSAEYSLTDIAILTGGVALSRIVEHPGVTAGTWAVRAACDGVANGQGYYYKSETGIGTMGTTYSGSIDLCGTPGVAVIIRLRFFYADASNELAATTAYTLTAEPERISTTVTANPAKALDYVTLQIASFVVTPPIAAFEIISDAAQVEEGQSSSYTDGDRAGSAWSGTAHASSSVREESTITVPLAASPPCLLVAYREIGPAWSVAVLDGPGALGRYATVAWDTGVLEISTTRKLELGNLVVMDERPDDRHLTRLLRLLAPGPVAMDQLDEVYP